MVYSGEKAFDEGTDLIEIYNNLIKDTVTRVNPLKYALITVNASRQFTDFEEAIRFLEAVHDHPSRRTEDLSNQLPYSIPHTLL